MAGGYKPGIQRLGAKADPKNPIGRDANQVGLTQDEINQISSNSNRSQSGFTGLGIDRLNYVPDGVRNWMIPPESIFAATLSQNTQGSLGGVPSDALSSKARQLALLRKSKNNTSLLGG